MDAESKFHKNDLYNNILENQKKIEKNVIKNRN